MTAPGTPSAAGRIRPRERDSIIASLRAGMVPRSGQQHIQVGRATEVRAAVRDIDRIVDGGAGCRFVIGDYGSGKTFFLQLIRSVALQKNLLTVHADLAPDRRLQATGGQVREWTPRIRRAPASPLRPFPVSIAPSGCSPATPQTARTRAAQSTTRLGMPCGSP